jgi:hypothetical protein
VIQRLLTLMENTLVVAMYHTEVNDSQHQLPGEPRPRTHHFSGFFCISDTIMEVELNLSSSRYNR